MYKIYKKNNYIVIDDDISAPEWYLSKDILVQEIVENVSYEIFGILPKLGNFTNQLLHKVSIPNILKESGTPYSESEWIDFYTNMNTSNYISDKGSVSISNNTSTLLTAGATFTGIGEDVSMYPSVVIACKTDQNGTLYVDFSPDNTNWDNSLSFTVTAGINEVHRITVTRKYFRVRFTNTSASNQTYLRLQSLFGNQSYLTSALNSSVQQDSDAITVRSIDSHLEIAAGKFTGYLPVNKFGTNGDIDVGTEDIWGVGGTWIPPTSAGTVALVSTSASDTSAGVGARTVIVNGLNASYEDTTETVILKGTTSVNTVNSYIIIHSILVETAGSGGTAVGDITAKSNGGGTPILGGILIGTNHSQIAIYQIPSGYTGYMSNYEGGMQGGGTLDLKLFIKPFGGVYNLKGTLALNLTGSSYSKKEFYTPLKITEKSIIKLTGVASANNTEVHASFDLILIKN